jgi:hypothetical protein
VNDQPVPAKSKRRPLLIICGLLLLALAIVGYLLRPRLDPRFLGKWRERPGELYEAEWTFKDDGTLNIFTYSKRAGGKKINLPYRWFIFRGRFYQTSGDISSTAAHAWKVFTGTAETPNVLIEEVTPESILLRPVYPGPRNDAQLTRLTRIVE